MITSVALGGEEGWIQPTQGWIAAEDTAALAAQCLSGKATLTLRSLSVSFAIHLIDPNPSGRYPLAVSFS